MADAHSASGYITESVLDMNKTEANADITQTLGIDGAHRSRFRSLTWLGWGIAVLVILALIVVWQSTNNAPDLQYRTEEARRGSLVVTVSATGNLEPTNQVDVSSELSGIIDRVMVDYNDRVEAGQVLAGLDTDKLQAEVLQSEAALAAAEAKVKESQATVLETKLKLQRCERLAEKGLCPQEEVDTNSAAYKRALAEEGSARAQVAEARAKLGADRTSLAKTEIHSPINGVVLVRAVEPGQTVAASLQAPVLFTLAEDLSEMELHVDVDEADVGQVEEGQQASFSVDAFPERVFKAQITQVRYGAQEVEGVITYETVLKVDNSELSLRPGMTATAEITVKQVNDALLVPNAALRFSPAAQSGRSSSQKDSLLSQLMPRPPGPSPKNAQKEISNDKGRQQVWTLRDGEPVAIAVSTGTTDGIWTEITRGELQAGTALLVASVRAGR